MCRLVITKIEAYEICSKALQPTALAPLRSSQSRQEALMNDVIRVNLLPESRAVLKLPYMRNRALDPIYLYLLAVSGARAAAQHARMVAAGGAGAGAGVGRSPNGS